MTNSADGVVSSPQGARAFLGRERELWDLAAFVRGSDGRRDRVLAVLGRPGVGRSALLEELGRRLGVPTVHADGDAAALAARVGRSPAQVMLIDDAQALGEQGFGEFARALRRLPASAPRLVIAIDSAAPIRVADAGIPFVTLAPLTRADAAELLQAFTAAPLAGPVAEAILSTGAGNPRALIDLAASLSTDQLGGRRRLPDPLPLHAPAARWWRRRLLGDAPPAGDLTLLALEAELPLSVFSAAAVELGVSSDTEDGERRQLVRVHEGRVGLRPPVVRSAVWEAADPARRSRAHDALADALAADEPDRAAWHRGLAATGVNETVADALESTTTEAERHGGAESVADALELAAELTSDQATASRRRVNAALASWQAGWRQRAARLLDDASPLPDVAETRATSALVVGALALSGGDPNEAFRALVVGADSVGDREDSLALDLVARAAGIAWWNGRADLADATVSVALRRARSDEPWGTFVREMTVAGRDVVSGRLDRLRATLSQVIATGETLDEPRRLIFASESAGVLGDDVASIRLLQRAARLLTGDSIRPEAPFALQLLAIVNCWQGVLHGAREAAAEGVRLAAVFGEETAGPFQLGMRCHIAALEGDSEGAEAFGAAAELAAGGTIPTVRWALGRLDLARGRHESALSRLSDVVTGPAKDPLVALFVTPDYVEAAMELGRPDLARAAMQSFERWCSAGSPWALAVAPRLRALFLEGDARIEGLLLAARDSQVTRRPFEEARTLMLLGRELRRRRRRSESREYFRSALSTFELFGLSAWAERVRGELRAAGDAVSGTAQLNALTEQELQISRLVAAGASNRNVAEQLHLSSRTVEYHLSKVYVKLGLSSRAQLARLLDA